MLMVAQTIGDRGAKDALFDGFARVAAALASGRRLEILDVLAQAPRSVEDLSGAIGQSVANTSHHLRRLADDGLVKHERIGRRVVYRLASERVYQMWRALQDVAEQHHEQLDPLASDYLGDRQAIRRIDLETLRARLADGEDILVIDVRPRVEFEAGHLDGAISVPPELLETALAELPPTGEVVAYCRGAYCAYADMAVRALERDGRTAARLDVGYPELRLVGRSSGQSVPGSTE